MAIETTEQIFTECTGCLAGMELFKDTSGIQRKHKISFEADLGKFSHIKKGNYIPNKGCSYCEEELLIRV